MDKTLSKSETTATVKDEVNGKIKPEAIKEKAASPKADLVCTRQSIVNLLKLYQGIGLRMPKKHRCAYILYSIILNGTVSLFLVFGFLLSYMQLDFLNLKKAELVTFLTSLQAFFNVLSCEIRIWMLTFKRHKWRSADEIMERLDRRCRQSTEQEDLLRVCVRYCNMAAIFYTLLFWVYAVSTCVGAYIVDRTPYGLYLPFLDKNRSRSQFMISMFVEWLLISGACAQQGLNDGFILVYVIILRTHMKILLVRFEKLGDESMNFDKNLEELKQCIRDHKNYLKLYEIISPIISSTIFIQFLVTAMTLSTSLVNVMLIGTDLNTRVGSFIYIVAVISEIVPLCYNAQCLLDDSNRLAEVVFHSNWYTQDWRFRKMLVFLMHRTQCTKELMAGKLLPINLSCCLSIVKFAFTLFTFIKTMGLEEKFK